ncbi:hypothetical protein D7030_07840 [Flavobacteriaceae bacterium AU392]|nr:hypothetical protein D1817_00575 [Flavobacteriaceae bacterium]RKM85034.1 hypothetical protein D7030_07840 [Flavobacteriaceae bacterium AU392]
MKKQVLTLSLIFITFSINAQDASVEDSFYGIQTGFLGIWVHNETKLSNKIALRTELGLDAGFFYSSAFSDNLGFLLAPVITLEPRWYYNLDKRQNKSKNIKNNSGNFLSLDVSYHPDLFVISNNDNVGVIDQVSVIPKWGIRRSIGNHFNYETGIGVGYNYIFGGFNEGEVAVDLHLRIGYKF